MKSGSVCVSVEKADMQSQLLLQPQWCELGNGSLVRFAWQAGWAVWTELVLVRKQLSGDGQGEDGPTLGELLKRKVRAHRLVLLKLIRALLMPAHVAPCRACAENLKPTMIDGQVQRRQMFSFSTPYRPGWESYLVCWLRRAGGRGGEGAGAGLERCYLR